MEVENTVENLCCCCMVNPPFKGLKTPYIHFGTTEVFLDMIEECFQMQLTLDYEGGSGVCEDCVGRLRDACSFKRQVQRCQAKLRAKRARRDTVVLVKDEVCALEVIDEIETSALESADGIGTSVLESADGIGPCELETPDGIGTSDESDSSVDEKPQIPVGPDAATPEGGSIPSTDEKPEIPGPDSTQEGGSIPNDTPIDRPMSGEGLISLSWRDASGASTRPLPSTRLAPCSVRLERLRDTHTCTRCSLSFSQASALSLHTQEVHNDAYKAAVAAKKHLWICDTCGKKYKKKHTLIRHFKSHEKKYVYTSNLNQFLVIHPGEKPFGCKICGKLFETKFYLTRHTVVHTKLKAFVCDTCNKEFKYKHVLTRHMLSHSGKEPTYKCGFCDKSFANKSGLNQHMPIHTGIKAYVCPICEKTFAHRHTLINHVRIHTGQKPYACEICNKAFTERGQLKRHTRVHTGQRPYKCDICDRPFGQKIHVQIHKARVHT